MAGDEHYEFTVTVPSGTPKTAPIIVPTVMPARKVVSIAWTIPPGASGFTGFRITMGGIQVAPVNLGAWIIRDGTDGASSLAKLPDSGAWDITAYNTGAFPHTIYVTYYVDLIKPAPLIVVPFGLDELQFGVTSPLAHKPRQVIP